jgi:hypothetical protein
LTDLKTFFAIVTLEPTHSVFFGPFLSGCFFPPNDRAQNHAQENPLLVLFLLAQKCLWTLNMEKYGKNIYFFEQVDYLGGSRA